MNWPDEQPVFETPRLTMRPLKIEDAPVVERLVGTMDIAAMVASIPHPYPEGAAAAWIERVHKAFAEKRGMNFATIWRDDDEFVACAGIHMQPEPCEGVGEIGYWVAVPHWGRGIATEATKALVRYGFEELRLRRIEAHHISANPSSGRVMQKVGMKYEGTMRQRMTRFGRVHDVIGYGMVCEDYEALKAGDTVQ